MRKLREILRLRPCAELSLRQIQSSQRVSLGAVQEITRQAKAQNLAWSEIEQLDDQHYTLHFYPEADVRKSAQFQLPLSIKTTIMHSFIQSNEMKNIFSTEKTHKMCDS